MKPCSLILIVAVAAVYVGCESEEESTSPPIGATDAVAADGGPTDIAASDGLSADASTADSSMADTASNLSWFSTCGDPVCSGYSAPDPPIDMCGALSATAGDACATEGQRCDPMDNCNAQLVCAETDPKTSAGGCPISRRVFKTDITYVSPSERDALAKELLTIPLARWRYLHEGAETPAHLGFIIEDVEPSHAVQSRRDRVDLYGFTAMAVATIQAQQRKIEALERQLKRLEDRLAPAK